MGSIYFTLFVSLERYVYICHYFKCTRICTSRNALIAASLILLLAVLINIPLLFAYRKLDVRKTLEDAAEGMRTIRSWSDNEYMNTILTTSQNYLLLTSELGYSDVRILDTSLWEIRDSILWNIFAKSLDCNFSKHFYTVYYIF